MKITDMTAPPVRTSISLNDIPDGTTFKGEIEDRHGIWNSGVFHKFRGASTVFSKDGGKVLTQGEVIVVRLSGGAAGPYTWFYCRNVRDYQPVDCEIIIRRK